ARHPHGARCRLRDARAMSFRLRVTLLAAGAVAVAAIAAAALMYVVLQQQLVHQIDQSLADASQTARQSGPRPGPRGFRPFGDRNVSTGRADIVAQSIDAPGKVIRAHPNPADPPLATAPALQVPRPQSGEARFETTA